MVLMMGLLALAGCSSDNESVMLDDYNLLANVETPDGEVADGATVTLTDSNNEVNETKTADENGVVQFKKLSADAYTLTAKKGNYIQSKQISVRGIDETVSIRLAEEFWLYSSVIGATVEIQEWSGAAELSEVSDANFEKVFAVKSGTTWSSLAFAGLSSNYQSDFESVTFKVKSDDLEKISIKIPEATVVKTIENGEDLGNGWYEFTIPFSDFEGTNSDATQLAFIAEGEGVEAGDTFYITDVYMNAASSVEDTTKTPRSLSGQTNLEMIEGDVIDLGGEDVTVTYTDDSTKTISSSELTFSSSDTNVATINGRSLTAEAEGTATITASYTENGTTVTADIDLTVNPLATLEDTNGDGNIYLYSSSANADDIGMTIGVWNTGSTLNDSYEDPDFNPVYQVQSGSGWGKPAACISFENFETGFADLFTSLKFKVYSENGLGSIFVKFDNMAGEVGHELEFDYATYGSAISGTTNNWYEVTIPLSKFNNHGSGSYEQFGIHSGYGNADTFYITDISFERLK